MILTAMTSMFEIMMREVPAPMIDSEMMVLDSISATS
jgi:hypothetical protein